MPEPKPHPTKGAPHAISPSLHRSATLNANLAPIVRTGFLIQDEICAASVRVTTDLTASAARRGSDTSISWLDLSVV